MFFSFDLRQEQSRETPETLRGTVAGTLGTVHSGDGPPCSLTMDLCHTLREQLHGLDWTGLFRLYTILVSWT